MIFFHLPSKVQLFWEGHNNLHNILHGSEIYLVKVKIMKKIVHIFVTFNWTLITWFCDLYIAKNKKNGNWTFSNTEPCTLISLINMNSRLPILKNSTLQKKNSTVHVYWKEYFPEGLEKKHKQNAIFSLLSIPFPNMELANISEHNLHTS